MPNRPLLVKRDSGTPRQAQGRVIISHDHGKCLYRNSCDKLPGSFLVDVTYSRYPQARLTKMNDRLRTVVCIEDEPEMIQLFKLILSRHNYQVFGASDGKEGLATIAKVRPDVVLLDLMMPEMDGWEVFQKMKATKGLEDIPVIVVTAKAQSIDRVLGLHIARVDDYITKPFGPDELLESVNKAARVQRSAK